MLLLERKRLAKELKDIISKNVASRNIRIESQIKDFEKVFLASNSTVKELLDRAHGSDKQGMLRALRKYLKEKYIHYNNLTESYSVSPDIKIIEEMILTLSSSGMEYQDIFDKIIKKYTV